MPLPLIYHHPWLTLLSMAAANGNPLGRGSQIHIRMRAHGAVYTRCIFTDIRRYRWTNTHAHDQ